MWASAVQAPKRYPPSYLFRIVSCSEEAQKKASDDDVAKMQSRLKQDASFISGNAGGLAALSRHDIAQQLVQASDATSGGSAFAHDGRAVSSIGDVRKAFEDAVNKATKKNKDDPPASGSAASAAGAAGADGEGGQKKDVTKHLGI